VPDTARGFFRNELPSEFITQIGFSQAALQMQPLRFFHARTALESAPRGLETLLSIDKTSADP